MAERLKQGAERKWFWRRSWFHLLRIATSPLRVIPQRREHFIRAGPGQLRLILIMPDTSPRGEGVPDEDGFDVGVGASLLA